MSPELRVITLAKTPYSYPKTMVAAGLALALLASSCSASQTPAEPPKKPTLVPAEKQPTAKPMLKPDAPTPLNKIKKMTKQEQILFARQDLAKRLKTGLDEVRLSGAVSVTWRSGALGCPKPGMQYTQALVPGLSMMLVVDKKAYRYHAKIDGEPFHCPDEYAETPHLKDSDI